MVRYGLAKVLRGVKALQTRKKSANYFEYLLLLLSSTYGRIILIISLNFEGNFGVPLYNLKPKFVAFLWLPLWHFGFFLLFRRGKAREIYFFPPLCLREILLFFHMRSN